MLVTADELFKPFTFANGMQAKNRFFKSAMEEHLSENSRVSAPLTNLYKVWAKGGAGVLLTGNVMVSPNGKGAIEDVVVTDDSDLAMLTQWAQAGKINDTLMIMQINHAGKQAPKNAVPNPVAPSNIPLKGMEAFINPPKALTDSEIRTIIAQFATTANVAEKAGFSGVQIHGAHGYLISQFLSPHHNRRDDDWGGSLDNRMRFLAEIYQAIRQATQPGFLVGLKLNSADFQKGGFSEADSVQVVQKMAELGMDFIEISGGNYENPAMMGAKQSTVQREAFFLDYAKKVRALTQVPLIITGGFRSVKGMTEALASADLDFIGIARPLAIIPDLPNRIAEHDYHTVNTPRVKTGFKKIDKPLSSVLEMGWYREQIYKIAHNQSTNPKLSAWQVLAKTLIAQGKSGLTTGRAK